MTRNADKIFYFDEGPRAIIFESLSNSAEEPDNPGGLGRSFESIRMGTNEVSARWLKASMGLYLWLEAKRRWSRNTPARLMYAFDDPLKNSIFSVLVEMMEEPAREERIATAAHSPGAPMQTHESWA